MEKYTNKGKPMDLKKLLASNLPMPLFTKCTGHIETGPDNHGNRGFSGIYCGITPPAANVVEYGHLVLDCKTKKIVKVRVVRPTLCSDGKWIYPFCQAPSTPISPSPDTAGPPAPPPLLEPDPAPTQPEEGGRISMGEKYPPGTMVMTTTGPAEVQKKYDDRTDDYALLFGSHHDGMREAYSVNRKDFWLLEDYPDYE